MEKSLVVRGKSLEEAMDKAATLLHCPKERVAYEILREPRLGRHGQPGVLCKLRVTPVSLAAEELDPDGSPTPEVEEQRPWAEGDLEALPSAAFLASLQNLVAQAPRIALFAETVTPSPAAERLELVRDVTLSGGPIRHDGDVRVHGHVRKGVRIQAAGGIHITGDVETAFLDAEEDIVIAGGLLGTARSRCGSVSCKFAQGARLDAPGGSVFVQESAMHTHIRAGRSAFVGDILLGGSCYAEGLIEARIAGSESGVPTLLIAGRNKRLSEEAEDVRVRAKRAVTRMREHDAVCRDLLPTEEAGQVLPVADRLRLWRALMAKTRLNDALTQMAREKSRLLGMINADRTARICIMDRAYPKVKVIVDDQGQELKNLTQYATFSKDHEAGELRITPYR